MLLVRPGNHIQTEEKLIQKVSWEVRMRIMSKQSNGRFFRSRENEELCCNWGLSDGMFGGLFIEKNKERKKDFLKGSISFGFVHVNTCIYN
jgi:hypothetical protein